MKPRSDQKFGDLLSKGIRSVAANQNQLISKVEDDIGDMLGYSGKHIVEYWRKGHVPNDPDIVLKILKFCIDNGKLDITWAKQFLDYGKVAERDRYLYELSLTVPEEHGSKSAQRRNQAGQSIVSSSNHELQPNTKSMRPPENSFKWIRIPEGPFWMGSNLYEDPEASDNETPRHSIYLPEFYVAQVPVTNFHYQAFIEATNHIPPRYWENGVMPSLEGDYPVVGISWFDAVAFCEWAKVRLLSEAEWEKAARGIDGRKYPWGNNPPDKRICNYDMNWGATTSVNEFKLRGASPYGAFDMVGNVWEWTTTICGRDPSHNEYSYPYDPFDGRENLDADDSYYRIIRGGAFDRYAKYIRAACRRCLSPNIKYRVVGFRVGR